MRKLILFIFIVMSVSAQDENKGQSIELPDFVITGKQSISLPTMKKVRPDLVPILSQDFFYPSFTPEDFTFSSVTMPEKTLANLMPAPSGYNAQLILGAGQYTLPTGEFNFGKSFESGQFYTKLWGSNVTDYEPNSDYNVSGIQLNTDFFINRKANALPGMIISIDGYFIRDDYYFYGADDPTRERETQRGGVNISADNQYSDIVKYGVNFAGNYLDVKKTGDLKELTYSADGFVKFVIPQIDVTIKGGFMQQKLDIVDVDDETLSFYNMGGIVTYKVSPGFYIKGGLTYYRGENSGEPDSDKDLVAPLGELGFRASDKLSFTISYSPYANVVTLSDAMKENRFLYLDDGGWYHGVFGAFEKYEDHFVLNAKYAYDKYYEINVGVEASKVQDYHCYEGIISGFFNMYSANEVDIVRLYTEAMFHLGPMGWLYGSVVYNHTDIYDIVELPYEPQGLIDVTYGYDFNFGFSAEVGVVCRVSTLQTTDFEWNDDTYLDDYVNLTADFRYGITENFDITLALNNLLNRDNYLWEDYLEKPFDFIAGIDYRF